MTGSGVMWERFNSAGERLLSAVHFSTVFDGMVVSSSSVEYGEPSENHARLSLGEDARIVVPFTEEQEGFGQPKQERSGTLEVVARLEAFEEVIVPAGTFQTARVRLTETFRYDDAPGNPRVEVQVEWRAKDIGRVKRIFPNADSEDGHHSDELVTFSIPDGPGDELGESFSEWAATFELPEGEDSPADNPSGDGIANGVKYALGLDPLQSTRDALPGGEIEEFDGADHLVMEIPLNEAAAGDVELFVEVSDDLANWESGAGHVEVLEETDTFLRVRDETPVSATDERFARVRVVLSAE